MVSKPLKLRFVFYHKIFPKQIYLCKTSKISPWLLLIKIFDIKYRDYILSR